MRTGPSVLDDLRWRGLLHQLTDERSLSARLDAGPLVAYCGFDPSANSLHVGNLQQLVLLRRLADAGHRPIALIGGGTGMIGDPSGKSEERNLLDASQLDANRAAVAGQVSVFFEERHDAIVADNAEWLEPAGLLGFLRDVGKSFRVNEMVRKDSVRSRLEGHEQGLSFTEFSYMLLQAWDFLHLHDRYGCVLQIGGSDQWGNITEGVDLIRRHRGRQAYGITSPLITKADGAKFGKTESGTVWLAPERTSPYEFFQFWLRAPDADVGGYLRRLTLVERPRIEELDAATAAHPQRREAQRALARELTAMVHGATEAAQAERTAAVLFTEEVAGLDGETLAGALADAPTTAVARGELEGGLAMVEALVRTGLAGSRRDARQLLAQGSVHLNGRRVGEDRPVEVADALHGRFVVLRRGRSTQHVLRVEP